MPDTALLIIYIRQRDKGDVHPTVAPQPGDVVLVADGHSTPERPADPTAAQIIAHHNAIFTNIQYKGPSIAVTPAARVGF
jgi:hypothetical protein